ncbi:aldehyde dehydrogenase, dimeric NADP-preferring [Phlyctochytrium arcticum]|nr:aldehyde dehydrogenase, dimeric NADP-preferring [Phlyctochytrium arcticum]
MTAPLTPASSVDRLDFTAVKEIPAIHASTVAAFASGKTRPLAFRKEQLSQLMKLVTDNTPQIATAIYADLRKPITESVAYEVMGIQGAIQEALASIDEWAKHESVEAPAPFFEGQDLSVRHDPVGTVLIIGPWNYPARLILVPLVGAIVAGCTAVIKPSEVASNTSRIIAELMPKYLDEEAYQVVTGGVAETTALLELRWDKILYTGNGSVGRIILAAAAKHLTPVILELGGKCPVVVTKDADLDAAAKRIAHGKFINNGQTCVAPDYLLVDESVKTDLLDKIKAAITANWTENPQSSDSYSRMVNERHFNRITKVLDASKGEILVGNKRDAKDLYLAPTVVDLGTIDSDAAKTDSLMEDELFAPVLPVISFPTGALTSVTSFINAKPSPLALYFFGTDSDASTVLDSTRSGGVAINDVVVHLIPTNVPFGGTGESGMGAYQGKESFLAFTHRRTTLKVKGAYTMDAMRALPYPPLPVSASSAQ